MENLAQHLQFVEGLSPLRAAMCMLPGVVASMAGMLLSPIIARRIRPSLLIGAGLAVSATGCILLSQVGAGSGLSTLIVGYIFFNVGAAPFASLSSDLIVGSAPPAKAGSAAAMLQTSGEFAFALGIAVLGSIGTYVYRTQIAGFIPREVTELTAVASRESLAGAVSAAKALPEPIGSTLLHGAQIAFTDGMQAVVAVSGGLIIAIAILTVIKLRHIPPIGQKTPGDLELSTQESGKA